VNSGDRAPPTPEKKLVDRPAACAWEILAFCAPILGRGWPLAYEQAAGVVSNSAPFTFLIAEGQSRLVFRQSSGGSAAQAPILDDGTVVPVVLLLGTLALRPTGHGGAHRVLIRSLELNSAYELLIRLAWAVQICAVIADLLHARTNPFLARDRELTTQIRLAACLNSGLLEGYRGALFVVSACGRRPDGTTAPRRCIIARILSYLTTVSLKGVASACLSAKCLLDGPLAQALLEWPRL